MSGLYRVAVRGQEYGKACCWCIPYRCGEPGPAIQVCVDDPVLLGAGWDLNAVVERGTIEALRGAGAVILYQRALPGTLPEPGCATDA